MAETVRERTPCPCWGCRLRDACGARATMDQLIGWAKIHAEYARRRIYG